MSVIVASQSLADSATLTSSSYPYTPESVITATITNGGTPPSQFCQVALQATVDNVSWIELDKRWGLAGASAVTQQVFDLSNYSGNSYSTFMGGYNATAPWLNYRLVFGGNVGAAVTIAASDSDQGNQVVVTLTGVASTNGGAMGSWQPPQGGPIIINNIVVLATANSGGAASMNVGVATNNAATSSNLINATSLAGANNSIVVSGTGGSTTAQALLTGNQAITFTGNANSAGYAAKAYITYTKP